jgi:hypothetical protein
MRTRMRTRMRMNPPTHLRVQNRYTSETNRRQPNVIRKFCKVYGIFFREREKKLPQPAENHLLKCKSIMVIFFGKGKETTTTGGKIIF